MQGGQVRPPNYTIAGESYAIVQRQRVADALREIAKQSGILEVRSGDEPEKADYQWNAAREPSQ